MRADRSGSPDRPVDPTYPRPASHDGGGDGLITSESAQEREYGVLNTRRRRALACAGVTAALGVAIAPQAMAGPLNAGGAVDLLTDANVKLGNLAAASKVGETTD